MENRSGKHKVFEAISKIQGHLAEVGIPKDKNNTIQGYKFRGIDDIYSALAPLLFLHNLVILPQIKQREYREVQSQKGNVLFYTTLTVEYRFVHAEDESETSVCVIGEAMDSGDKSVNKAMSAAYKYMALQTFCIPTEGDNDTENTNHVVVKSQQLPKVDKETGEILPNQGYDWTEVVNLGVKNRWPKGYIMQWLKEKKEQEGLQPADLKPLALEKFGKVNDKMVV